MTIADDDTQVKTSDKRFVFGLERHIGPISNAPISVWCPAEQRLVVRTRENDLMEVYMYSESNKLDSVLVMKVGAALALRDIINEAVEHKTTKTGGQRLFESEMDGNGTHVQPMWYSLSSTLQSKYETRAQKLGIAPIEEWMAGE